MKKVKISIVIVNYKVEEKVLNCIKSIYESKPKINFEVIVVDNSSSHSFKLKLNKIFPKIKFIKSKSNLGYGAGNNLGIQHAIGEYIFILNPDTRLISGKIENFIKFIENKNKIGVVAPVLVNSEMSPYELQGTKELSPKRAIFSLSFLAKIFPKNEIYKDYYNTSWDKNSVKEVEVVPGTAFVIRKRLFEEIGGFDENFFLYFEEFDFCKRLKNVGYRNYIIPNIKFYHEWGASTKLNEDSLSYFQKSRFYYFKKHFGLLKALLTESFLRFNKFSIILFFTLVLGFFLRTYRLDTLMTFIGDQGYHYLAARDILIHGIVPLVGPETSHPWLHHGALWIYNLAILFKLFNFNPVIPAYYMALIGTITILLFYFIVKNIFDQKTAILSSMLYAASPFIVTNDRLPFHTSPIPLFVIILFFLTFKWMRGNIWMFPFIAFILGILYNLELNNFVYFVVVGLVFFYGFYKKYDWSIKLINLKVILASIVSFSIPMIPFFVYDITHGYKQTIVFLGWIVFRVVKFPLSIIDPRFKSPASGPVTISQFLSYYRDLIFSPHIIIALIVLALTISFTVYYFSRSIKFDKKNKILKSVISISFGLLYLFLGVSLIGSFVHRVPTIADVIIFFPFVIIISAISLLWILKDKFLPSFILVLFIVLLNTFSLINTEFFTKINGQKANTFEQQFNAAGEVIRFSDGKKYNIEGRGALSDFRTFTMPYEYILWWRGNPPELSPEKLKVVIWETSNGIKVYKR